MLGCIVSGRVVSECESISRFCSGIYHKPALNVSICMELISPAVSGTNGLPASWRKSISPEHSRGGQHKSHCDIHDGHGITATGYSWLGVL